MANRVNVEISANTTGYKNAIDEAKQANAQFQSSIEKIDVRKLNREYRETQKSVRGLALQLAQMEKAGKINTAPYRQLQRELMKAKQEAAELLDVVSDNEKMVRALSSDTLNLDTFKEGVTLFRDMGTALATLGIESEGLESVITKIAQIQGVANAAISISNALNKDSIIMQRIKIMQEAALSRAIDAETAATGKATVAQRIYNAVAKANPYVLLATGLIAVGAAIAGYIAWTNKATAEDEKHKKQLEEAAKAQESYNKTMSQSFGNLMGKYAGLRAQWRQLSSEHQKNQWIKNNKSEFEQLGLKVNNVADAENIFDQNTSKVVEGFKKRAEAAAVSARMVELYTKQLELENQYLSYYQGIRKQAGDEVKGFVPTQQDPNGRTYNNGELTYNTRSGKYEYTAKGAEKANDELLKTDKTLQNINNDYKEVGKQIDTNVNKLTKLSSATGKVNNSTTTSTSPKNETKPLTDSLADYEKQLSDLQKARKDGLLPDMDTTTYIKKIEDLKKQIEDKKIELGIELPKTELEEIDEKINTLKANQLRVETRLDPAQYQAELKRLENEKHELKVQIGLEVEPSAFDKLKKTIEDKLKEYDIPLPTNITVNAEPSKLDKLQKELEQYTYIQMHSDLSDEDLAIIRDKIKSLKEEIQNEEIEITGVVPNIPLQQKEEEKSELVSKQNKIINDNGGIPEPNTAAYAELLSIFEQIRDVEKEITELQDPQAAILEKQTKATQQRAQALQGIGGAVSGLGNAIAQLGDKEDKGVQVAALIAQAIGSVLAGAGTAIAQSASMGPWAWLAFSVTALATAATTIAQIKNLGASAKGYAQGGIIGGNSFFGDQLLVRANSGEGIINERQQKRLYDIANGVVKPNNTQNQFGLSSIAVEGTELLLVINNTLKEQGKNPL